MEVFIVTHTKGMENEGCYPIPVSYAFSTLEKAKEHCERYRNKTINPSPYEFEVFDTQHPDIFYWTARYRLHRGEVGYITITKCPIDTELELVDHYY